jgi:hypothetical protein
MKQLQEIRKEYIFIDEQLVDYINIYFLIENKWYCFSFLEGEANFNKIDEFPILLNYEKDKTNQHNIISIPLHNSFLKIKNISKMSFNNYEYGFLFEFENSNFITYFEDNDETSYFYFMKLIYQKDTILEKLIF